MTTKAFTGYKRATVADFERQRLLGISWGEPGSRKTTFWLEGPSPIGVLSFDQGLEGVVSRVLREHPKKDIYVQEFDWSPTNETGQEEASDIWNDYEKHFRYFLEHCRTVLIDKENDLWQLARYSEFGDGNSDQQKNYDKLNLRYRKLVNLSKQSNCNVGFVRGCKDEWGTIVKRGGQSGKGPTGNRIPAGFTELEGLVHLSILHTGLNENTWSMQIGKVRGPGALEVAGQEFPSMSFADFAQLVYPETTVKDWE